MKKFELPYPASSAIGEFAVMTGDRRVFGAEGGAHLNPGSNRFFSPSHFHIDVPTIDWDNPRFSVAMSTPPPSRLSVVIHLQHSAGFAERFLSDQYPPSLRALLAQPSPPFLGPSAVPGQARRVVFHSSLNESQQVLTLPGSYTPTTLLSDIRRDLEAQFPHVPICRGSRFRRPREPWDEVRLFEDSETIGHAWQVIHKEEEEEHAELVAWDQQSSSFSSRSSQDEGIDAAVGSMEGSDSGQVKLGTSGDAGSSADAGGDVSRIENAGEKSPPAQESSPDPSRDPGAGEIHLLVCTTAGHLAELDGTILTNFLSWKRSAVRLSYLQKQDRDIPENSEMQQSKFLERQHREDLWRKLDEWDELISGVEAPEPVAEEKENRQEKEADIYVRMEKWNKMRKEKVETVADTEAEPVVVVHGFDDDSWEPPDPEEALLFPGISPADSASIVAVAIPRGDQGSDPPGPTDQSSFTVRSGVLLWGHLQTVFHGSNSQSFDSIVPPPALKGGTIVERILNYRAAARNGQWRVRKAYSNTGAEDEYAEPKRHFGHVVHHESVDPMEVLWWCAGKMGSSLDGEKEVSPFKVRNL